MNDHEVERLAKSAVFSMGVKSDGEHYEDCLSEAKMAILQCAPESTFGYKYTRARWAVSRFLTENTKAIRE